LRPCPLFFMVQRMQKIIVIVGPTASGKSAYAVKLAKRIGGEVISADSRQVYKGLDIGTGKITKKEMQGVSHHLLDVLSPKKVFTANEFVIRGRRVLEDIINRGKTPIICGGTGFYIDALLGRIAMSKVPPNPKLRAQLEKKTTAHLFAMLKKLDARRARDIDPENPVRLIRAIEIARAIGHVPRSNPEPLPYSIEWIGIWMPREKLHARIHARLYARMKAGMLAEAKRLHAAGLSYKRMEQLGLEYRYLALYLQKKITKAEMMETLESHIRDYAKRQLQYWKRNKEIPWREVK
jgi:tRNA dimethylallyltransferase